MLDVISNRHRQAVLHHLREIRLFPDLLFQDVLLTFLVRPLYGVVDLDAACLQDVLQILSGTADLLAEILNFVSQVHQPPSIING